VTAGVLSGCVCVLPINYVTEYINPSQNCFHLTLIIFSRSLEEADANAGLPFCGHSCAFSSVDYANICDVLSALLVLQLESTYSTNIAE